MKVKWTAFPLHPYIPKEGMTLEELFRGRSVDIPALKARLREVADGLGLEFGDRTHTYNSRLAQELAKWAEEQGRGDDFHMAVFRAYFVEGRNIGMPEVLMDIVSSVGLSSKTASVVLEERTYSPLVDEDWNRSKAMGITAVPTFVVGRGVLVGTQPYDALERLVVDSGASKRVGGG